MFHQGHVEVKTECFSYKYSSVQTETCPKEPVPCIIQVISLKSQTDPLWSYNV